MRINMVGEAVGEEVGELEGERVGVFVVGFFVGERVGILVVGFFVGERVGILVVGFFVGERVGVLVVGFFVGERVGVLVVGFFVGERVGVFVVGFFVGERVGVLVVGFFVGERVGVFVVGFFVGERVGAGSVTHAHIISRRPLQDESVSDIHVLLVLPPMPRLPVEAVLDHSPHVLLVAPNAVVPDHHSLESLPSTPASLSVVAIVPELHSRSHEDLINVPVPLLTGRVPEKLYIVFLFAKELVESEKNPNETLHTPDPKSLEA